MEDEVKLDKSNMDGCKKKEIIKFKSITTSN